MHINLAYSATFELRRLGVLESVGLKYTMRQIVLKSAEGIHSVSLSSEAGKRILIDQTCYMTRD